MSSSLLDEIKAKFLSSEFFQRTGYIIEKFDDEGAKISLLIQNQHLNVNGTLHGAIHAAMLDQIYSMQIRAITKCKCATVNLNINYLDACNSGMIYAEASFIKLAYKTAILEGIVYHEDGTILAKGTGVFKLIREKK